MIEAKQVHIPPAFQCPLLPVKRPAIGKPGQPVRHPEEREQPSASLGHMHDRRLVLAVSIKLRAGNRQPLRLAENDGSPKLILMHDPLLKTHPYRAQEIPPANKTDRSRKIRAIPHQSDEAFPTRQDFRQHPLDRIEKCPRIPLLIAEPDFSHHDIRPTLYPRVKQRHQRIAQHPVIAIHE